MTTREEQIALLGVLEQQLGERQRAMNGLHLDQAAAERAHAGMLRLQEEVRAQAARAAQAAHAAPPAEHPGGRGRHEKRPDALLVAAATVLLVTLALVALLLL